MGTPTPPGVPADAIEVRGLRLLGTHGVLEEERHRPQPFSVDLSVWADVARAGVSDELDDTVDYGALIGVAAEVLRGPSLQLLEALADRVALAVLAFDARIQGVTVTVRKLRPPVAADVVDVGVRRTRWRTVGVGAPGT